MNEHETKTVDAFIVREKRQRYHELLRNPKKRARVLDRLNHCADLDPRFAELLPSNTDVASLLRKHGSPDEVYIISDSHEIDGQNLTLDEALQQTESYGWGTIVSCVPGRLAYYYGEGGERRALLKRTEERTTR